MGEKITIVPKEKEGVEMHKEAIAKVFYIKEKRIPFHHQKTLANCGPLAIVNGILALEGINKKFSISKEFPLSSQGIRKLLASDESLKKTVFNNLPATEIEKDNLALQSGHMGNLIKRLEVNSNLKITGDRFSDLSGFPSTEIEEKIRNSDWLVCHKDFHYTSFVRLDNNDWVYLDSMDNQPVVVSQKFIEDNYKDIPQKSLSRFISLKLNDSIRIVPKENKIKIIKKEK